MDEQTASWFSNPEESLAEAPGLRLGRSGSIAHLIIDRTDRANALHEQMWTALPGLVEHAEQTAGVRVLVLRSATQKVFCAGADVAEYRANAGDPQWALANHTRVTGATNALATTALFTVAAVSGPCAGGGVGLITACDYRIGDTSASFAVPPTRLGLIYPQADTARLLDAVGPSSARYLLLTASRVNAEWALAHGLLDERLDTAGLPQRVDELGAAVAGGAPVSVAGMKRTIALALAGQRSDDEMTAGILEEALRHPDHEEGTAAFLERRKPTFGG